MRPMALHSRGLQVPAALAALALLAACGPKHYLDQYDFAGRRMALVVIAPPAPGLLESGYRVSGSEDVIGTVVQAGATAVKNAEAGRARARLDSATSRMALADALAERTRARVSRYLGMTTAPSEADSDFLLEIHMRSYGIDVRGRGAARLYTNAEAVLLDRRTGREIWNSRVRGTDRLTPHVVGMRGVPGTVITAGTLHTVTVADFEDALDQLVQLSANVIADDLRHGLRKARQ